MPRKTIAPLTIGSSATDPLKHNPPTPKKIKVLYRCRCQNTVEPHIRVDAVLCLKCGIRMKPKV